MDRGIQGQLKNIIRRTGSAHVDGRPGVSELSGLECFRGYDAVVCQRRAEALSFIVREPESLIPQQRAARRTSEDVPTVGILGHYLASCIQLMIEEVARPQRVVSTHPVEVRMKVIRTASAYDVHHCT